MVEKNPRAVGGGSRQRKAGTTRKKKLTIAFDAYELAHQYAHRHGHTLTGVLTLAIDRYERMTNRPEPEHAHGVERQQWNVSAMPKETADALTRLSGTYGASEADVVRAAILSTLQES